MVKECLTRHQHPWNILGEKPDPDHVQVLVLALDCKPDRSQHSKNAGPPDQRVPHSHDAAYLSFRQSFTAAEKPYRPFHEGPFPPGRSEGVGGNKLAVVIVHVLLRINQTFEGVAICRDRQNRDKGQAVNHAWNNDKKQHAAKQSNNGILPERTVRGAAGSLKLLIPHSALRQQTSRRSVFSVAFKQGKRQHDGKTRTPVDYNPLGGDADPKKQPRPEQRHQRPAQRNAIEAHREIPLHEIEHQHDEKYTVDVDGRDARLGEMHEIQCE
ncbi:hypothetical protein D3C73_918250 [compost metagenome]